MSGHTQFKPEWFRSQQCRSAQTESLDKWVNTRMRRTVFEWWPLKTQIHLEPWVVQMGTKSSVTCPYERHTEKRSLCEEGDRDWSMVTASQGTPGATRRWKGPRRTVPQSLQREHRPTNTLSLNSWPLLLASKTMRKWISVVFRSSACGNLF